MDAVSASTQAGELAPTQTLGTVSSPTTVAGNGGLNVIDVNGGIKASLTLSGSSNDVFVVNVTGTLALGGSSVLGLSGGVTADHVLYNFNGSGNTIATHVGNVINGTLHAPQSNFNLDGVFNGEIIGGGGSISLLSGATVNEVPFSDAPAGASLSGYVSQGGSGIAGVVVTLTGTDDQGNAVTLNATTDTQGYYIFNDLQAGTYTIEEPSGYGLNQTSVGAVPGRSDGSVDASGDIAQIILGAGDQGTNYDFKALTG